MIKHQGFTLIEMAIVLLVIALITGFSLKGSELIYNAKIKHLENQYHEIKIAVESYYDRYKYLPGDDPFAKERWYNNDPSYNGNGNYKIEGEFNESSDHFESRKAWGHLRAAKFISGSSEDSSQPHNKFGGIVGVSAIIYGVNIETYIGFTEVPIDILEQLKKKLANHVTVTYYRGSGSSDDGWLPCYPLPSSVIKTVNIVISSMPLCH